MANRINHFRRWLVFGGLGLAIFGFGVCLVSEVAIQKANGEAWFWPGTGALIVLNAGLSIFGQAVVHRVHYERERRPS